MFVVCVTERFLAQKELSREIAPLKRRHGSSYKIWAIRD